MRGTVAVLACLGALVLAGCPGNTCRSNARLAAGDWEGAEAQLVSCVKDCGTNRECELHASTQLGSCRLALAELKGAEDSFRRAVALARQMGLAQEEAAAANGLAAALLEQHLDRAAQDEAGAAERLAEQGQLFTLRIASASIEAMAMASLGNSDGGLHVVAEAEKSSRQIADPQLRHDADLRLLSTQAAIFRRAGDCERAEKAFHEVIDSTYGEAGDRTSFEAHLGLARCARQRGRQDEEQKQLVKARSLVREKEQRLQGKALGAWHLQTLPLIAAEEEATGLAAAHATADHAYAYALLYDADGKVKDEIRAAARVPAANPAYADARALIAPLVERIRVVYGRALWLRKGPDVTSRPTQQLPVGTWIEIVKGIPGWTRIRTELGTGWLDESPQTNAALRRLTEADFKG